MSAMSEIRGVFRIRLVKAFAMVVMLCAAPFSAVQSQTDILDYDLWWHLRTGDWILSHHSVPNAGLFSQYGANKPWMAYSWGFEVILSSLFKAFGLVGPYVLIILAEITIAWCMYRLLLRVSANFWTSVALTTLGMWAVYHNLAIRPVLITVLLWTITLTLILDAQSRGSLRPLYFLPVIFVIWANCHIQFVYGLFLVCLFVSVELVRTMFKRFNWAWPGEEQNSTLPWTPLVAIAAGCALVTLINPYGVGLYRVIWEYSRAKVAYSQISELSALSFRTSAHYVQLLLTAAAFFALGRKSRDPFKIVLMSLAAIIAYRTTRDSWFVCIPAMACIASAFTKNGPQEQQEFNWWQTAGVAAAVLLVAFGLVHNEGLNENTTRAAVSDFFPVRAADYVRANRIPGPLYNNLNFGGFLLWYLPEYPVAIDGRNDLYGDAYDDRFYGVLTGATDPRTDPDLQAANVVILQRGFFLTNYLYTDARFRPVFEDSNAVVFVKNIQ